jgi:glycosyltransferase involved in cell wall biosynthesis
MIDATIAVCTRNRVTLLERCLRSLATQVGEPGQFEVLVVDNGSSDGTDELLRAWRDGGPDRRVVQVPRAGISHARTAALQASEREVVVFTDDDALTPPGWARAHVSAYADPAVGSAGGPIGLIWPAERPSWVTDEMAEWYGALELGDEPCPFPTAHGPYGVNMSVRRTAALAVGGYDSRLGRRGSRLLSGEEPDLTRRLVEAGYVIAYAPTAGLVHQVLAERVRRRWLLRRGWAQGITNARLEVLATGPTRRHRIVRAREELASVVDHWRRRRSGDETRSEATARAVAAAGAGVEFLRLTATDGAPVRR